MIPEGTRNAESGSGEAMPKLYRELAPWWPLVSRPEDYEEEAAFFHQVLSEHADGPLQTMLELGCGGGNNASYLKAHYRLTLTDRSAAMLAVSRALNPECEHLEGDMRTLRLGRTFDVVFIHDAIMYMTTEADLGRAMQTAYAHCRDGGLALFVPDAVQETFEERTDHHGHDGQGRALRYLEWTFDPDPGDTTFVTAFAYLFRDRDGTLHADYEQHVEGLFGRQVWLHLLEEAGFQPAVIRDSYGRDLFLGRKG